MNKTLLYFVILFITKFYFAQIPPNYYDTATGSGAVLKTQLRNIITNGHLNNTYSGLWLAYATTDRDNFYENDGTILDIYSENPISLDPYNYTLGTNQCGNYVNEGDCYNREHIIPQSLFSSASPMVSDIHFIRATDGKVNNYRNNYPFGNVGIASYTSLNGSKLGNSVSAGYSNIVFEPINEFKGDVARMVFYFVTRYENELPTFNSGNMLGTTAYPGLTAWELQTLLAWHAQDPVSNTEIYRNNKSFEYQGNRNPYIDHPEYVTGVWGSILNDNQAPTTPSNFACGTATNQAIGLSWSASTDNVGVASYEVYINNVLYANTSNTNITVNGLSAATLYNFYIVAKDFANNLSSQSNQITCSTLTATSSNSCGTENFENIPTTSNTSYTTRNWISNGVSWNVNNARTDQTINNKSICYKDNATLVSSILTGGVKTITLTTQLKFSGTNGNLNVLVNNVLVGNVPYSTNVVTTTISNINVDGNVEIKIVNPHATNRVAIDDLTWTCLNASTVENQKLSNLKIVPNPIKDEFNIINPQNIIIKSIEIFDTTGKKIKDYKPNLNYNVSNLAKGNYLLKINTNEVTKIIKLIKK